MASARAFRCRAKPARNFASGEGLEQGFHRADSDGAGHGGDAVANGHGHERDCERRLAHAADAREPLEDRDGNVVQQYEPQRVRQVVSEATAQINGRGAQNRVTPDGTAPGAAMNDYTVAGKTGTAQKVENGTYAEHKFYPSFIGFFPADNPEICISVVMDEPKEGYFGGQVCGPVFKEIAERCASYLNIPPDKNLTDLRHHRRRSWQPAVCGHRRGRTNP